ncbi:MAG: hypothetical protein ACK4I8_02560 [Armatimonadota bacterium]
MVFLAPLLLYHEQIRFIILVQAKTILRKGSDLIQQKEDGAREVYVPKKKCER